MHRPLAEAVIATFREDSKSGHGKPLARFQLHDWHRSLHWLDSSGLALYLCERIRSQGLGQQVPAEILKALDLRRANNVARTAELFKEFSAVNREFRNTGLPYANLKGFTLVPDYCHDPALRCQLDLDFMVYSSDLSPFQDVLTRLGYSLTGTYGQVVEFKAGMAHLPSIRELYKPRGQRSVEVHLVNRAAPTNRPGAGPLERIRYRTWNGGTFAALSDSDMFLAQAHHLFRHVRSEWTRISWLLEFKAFVVARYNDAGLWADVRSQAAGDDDALAVGVALWLATRAFGDFAPPALLTWTGDAIPERIRLWLECYGEAILLAEFPGSKLYLLLERELGGGKAARTTNWGKLLPFHLPHQVTHGQSASIWQRIRANLSEVRFTLCRLRFHVTEGARYFRAALRWRRTVQRLQDVEPLPAVLQGM